MQKYNPYRFIVAKQRRGIKGSDLAKITGLNPKTISRLILSNFSICLI